MAYRLGSILYLNGLDVCKRLFPVFLSLILPLSPFFFPQMGTIVSVCSCRIVVGSSHVSESYRFISEELLKFSYSMISSSWQTFEEQVFPLMEDSFVKSWLRQLGTDAADAVGSISRTMGSGSVDSLLSLQNISLITSRILSLLHSDDDIVASEISSLSHGGRLFRLLLAMNDCFVLLETRGFECTEVSAILDGFLDELEELSPSMIPASLSECLRDLPVGSLLCKEHCAHLLSCFLHDSQSLSLDSEFLFSGYLSWGIALLLRNKHG